MRIDKFLWSIRFYKTRSIEIKEREDRLKRTEERWMNMWEMTSPPILQIGTTSLEKPKQMMMKKVKIKIKSSFARLDCP